VTDRPRPRPQPAPKIDTTVPNSARVWNYWLGGRDHYEIDRVAGYQFGVTFPGIVDVARLDRLFLGRVVRFLAGEAGVHQFLDIGTGLPTADNTHEVAQRVAPDARIVYVDNDPLVLAYARALLTSSPEGVTDYVDADLRDPVTILGEAAKTLDLTKPVALMLMGVLGHIGDYGEARSIVLRLLDGLPRGSYLAINDSIDTSDALEEALRRYEETGAVPYYSRSPAEFTGFLEGLEVLDPGIVHVPDWRPDPSPADLPADLPQLGAVGRKS
jgi:S-adenosyl methyltransferase